MRHIAIFPFLMVAFLLGDSYAQPQSTQPTAATQSVDLPPSEWIDPDTGHRVHRLSAEPGSDSSYFNINSISPDGQFLAYTAPSGAYVLNLQTLASKLLVSVSDYV